MNRPRETAAAVRLAAGLAWRARPSAAAGVLAVTIVAGLLPLAAAWLTKALVDELAARLGGGGHAGRFELIGAGLVVSAGLAPLIGPLTRYLTHELDRGIGLLVQGRLFGRINDLDGLATFERPAFHDRLRLAQHGGTLGPSLLVGVGTGIVQSLITVAGFVVTVIVVDPVLGAVTLAALLPSFAGELRLARARATLEHDLSPNDRRQFFYSRLQTEVSAAKELRLFGIGGHIRDRMLGEYRTIADAQRRLDRHSLRVQLGTRTVAALGAGVALALAVRQAFTGGLGPGDVVVVLAALTTLQTMSSNVALQIADLQHALLMLRHYREFLAAPPDLPRGSRPVPALRDAVELNDVWFRYADDLPWVLQGVSLRIGKGEAVALVGLNGAGKSTLVKLLCRFYDPTRGRVLWDGADLRDLRIDELRDRIGAVFQDFVTYDMTAAENIGLGDLARLHDRERIRAAASLARVDAALEALPHGYDTLLSREFPTEDANGTGTLLSGGQWQRLALGRMFMRATRDLLILDEPSSGLDVDAEHAVHRRFREQMTEATSLLISHRFNTVRMADRIVVIGAGRIVEEGSHDDLIAAGGEYARMFALQASGYAAAPFGNP